jgi:hypothetical protein
VDEELQIKVSPSHAEAKVPQDRVVQCSATATALPTITEYNPIGQLQRPSLTYRIVTGGFRSTWSVEQLWYTTAKDLTFH